MACVAGVKTNRTPCLGGGWGGDGTYALGRVRHKSTAVGEAAREEAKLLYVCWQGHVGEGGHLFGVETHAFAGDGVPEEIIVGSDQFSFGREGLRLWRRRGSKRRRVLATWAANKPPESFGASLYMT